MKGDRGSVTLWMVGLVMVVFVVGGIAIDLWRGLSAYSYVSSLVDSAAVAAGSGIDESVWRLEGRLVLDPARVRSRVGEAIAAQAGFPVAYDIDIAADGSEASVRAWASVDLTLLRLVTTGPVEVSARATVTPALSP